MNKNHALSIIFVKKSLKGSNRLIKRQELALCDDLNLDSKSTIKLGDHLKDK